jgi:hypothetical protein
MLINYWSENWNEKINHIGYLLVGATMYIKEIDHEDVGSIYLTHSKLQCRAVVNMEINFLIK